MGRAALDKFYQRARGDFPAPVPPLRWLRDDGADLSRLLVRAADDGLLEVLVPLLLGARVPMIIHRAGLAAIARPEDEAEDHDSADDGTSDAGCIVGTFVIAPILLIAAAIWCCYYCKKSNELKEI